MRSEKFFDLMVLVFIAAAGLATAYVCFGVLSSQANGRFEQYSLGGAITGALVSWSFLTTIYLKVRKSGDELETLRKANQELQGKLIRGAPRPEGFDIEVDERQRIVLARPKDWEPKGGIIFQLELPEEKMKPEDNFAATFLCSFLPIAKDSQQTPEQFHESQIKQLEAATKSGYVQSYSQEMMRLGGEAAAAESLKIIARQVARVRKERDPGTMRLQRKWETVSWAEFIGWIYDLAPRQTPVGHPATITVKGMGFHKGAVCKVNKKDRPTKVLGPAAVEVTLAPEDVANPGTLELAIENPETSGKQSNAVWLKVAEAVQGEQAPAEIPPGDAAKQSPPATAAAENSKEVKPPAAGKGKKAGAATEGAKPEEPIEVYLEIVSMTVICYQAALEKIFFFEFWDDSKDFLESSDEFNRILASTRFLS